MNKAKKKELSVCIWAHHIATAAGITEGIYYLAVKKQSFLKELEIFILTFIQLWAGVKIVKDLRSGRSRLTESYDHLKRLVDSEKRRKGILWGLTIFSVVFKVVPVHMLAHS